MRIENITRQQNLHRNATVFNLNKPFIYRLLITVINIVLSLIWYICKFARQLIFSRILINVIYEWKNANQTIFPGK